MTCPYAVPLSLQMAVMSLQRRLLRALTHGTIHSKLQSFHQQRAARSFLAAMASFHTRPWRRCCPRPPLRWWYTCQLISTQQVAKLAATPSQLLQPPRLGAWPQLLQQQQLLVL